MEEYSIKNFFENLTNDELEKQIINILFEDLTYEEIIKKLIIKNGEKK
jgi:hypothetical protein